MTPPPGAASLPVDHPADPSAPRRRAAHVAKHVSQGAAGLMIKDSERTRAEIIEVATKEFALRGPAAAGSTRSPSAPARPSG